MHTETGEALDQVGAQCGMERQQSEGDATYRTRIIGTGGPAFGEFKQAGQCSIKTGGVTVRDYFAAKALPVAWQAFENGYFDSGEDSINANVATCAYQMADAMLAARGESK